MLYALRKLIAFVFLLGIFWFVYHDLGNLGEDWFMHTLGVLVLAFAVFWLIVPWAVVRVRIARRRRQNRARYGAWRALLGPEGIHEIECPRDRTPLEEGERVFYHEKGTLYVRTGAGFDAVTGKGKPGDVAFPGCAKLNRRVQRVHCYVTDRRILFLGKEVDLRVAHTEVLSFEDTPGGVMFSFLRGDRRTSAGFTFQNPLIVMDILRHVRKEG